MQGQTAGMWPPDVKLQHDGGGRCSCCLRVKLPLLQVASCCTHSSWSVPLAALKVLLAATQLSWSSVYTSLLTQFCMWDQLKEVEEGELEVRRMTNLARLMGDVVVGGALSSTTLKVRGGDRRCMGSDGLKRAMPYFQGKDLLTARIGAHLASGCAPLLLWGSNPVCSMTTELFIPSPSTFAISLDSVVHGCIITRFSCRALVRLPTSPCRPHTPKQVVEFSQGMSAREVLFWRVFFQHLLAACKSRQQVTALFQKIAAQVSRKYQCSNKVAHLLIPHSYAFCWKGNARERVFLSLGTFCT